MWLGFSSNRLRNVAMLQDDRGTYHGENPEIRDDWFRTGAYVSTLMIERLWHRREVTTLHPGGDCGWHDIQIADWLTGLGQCLDDHALSLVRINIPGATFERFSTIADRLSGSRPNDEWDELRPRSPRDPSANPRPPARFDEETRRRIEANRRLNQGNREPGSGPRLRMADPGELNIDAQPGEIVVVNAEVGRGGA